MSDRYPRYDYRVDEPDLDFNSRARMPDRYRSYDHRVDEPDLDFNRVGRNRAKKRGKGVLKWAAVGLVAGAVTGFMDGAARALPPVMEGSVSVEKADAKVYKVTEIQELFVLNARMGITTAVKFEGHPFGVDAETAGGWVNFNAEKTVSANDVMRDVRKGFKLSDVMEYTYRPDRLPISEGGNPEQPAIEMDLDLSKDMITVVSDVPEIRDDDYKITNNGMLAIAIEKFGALMKQQIVQDALGGTATNLDLDGKMENLLRGSLRVHINEQAAKACMEQDKNAPSQSFLKTSVINSVKKIVIDDISKRVEGSKLTVDDVRVNLAELQYNDSVTNTDLDSDKKKQALASVIQKPVEIKVGPVTIPIKFSVNATETQTPICTYSEDFKKVER